MESSDFIFDNIDKAYFSCHKTTLKKGGSLNHKSDLTIKSNYKSKTY